MPYFCFYLYWEPGSLLALIYIGCSSELKEQVGDSFGAQQFPSTLSVYSFFCFFLLTFTACKTRRPNQFVAAVSTQGWTCHPEIINACLTSKTDEEDGVKAVTGRAIVSWVLTFHVQRSGNRNCFRWKLLEIQSRKLSTSFIYQALTFYFPLWICSILSPPQLIPFFFKISFPSFVFLISLPLSPHLWVSWQSFTSEVLMLSSFVFLLSCIIL